MIKIFIGYDRREELALKVLIESITKHTTELVSFCTIKNDLIPEYTRAYGQQSVDFTYSRFLVPYLCDYKGWALFMDCDMLVQKDISELWKLRDDKYALQVVKHDYKSKVSVKHDGEKQVHYPMKNWSSLMLFNCERCKTLTPDYVNTATGKQLHQFHWLDDAIGSLPIEWNWLVDEYEYRKDVANIHYTLGGPWFGNKTDYDDEWFSLVDASRQSFLA